MKQNISKFIWAIKGYCTFHKDSLFVLFATCTSIGIIDLLCETSITNMFSWPLCSIFFLSSISLILSKRWSSWLLIFVFTLWCMTLVIYYRANDLMLDFNAILMADNMHGFWTAILAYMNWGTWIMLLIPILYAIFLYFMPKVRTRMWKEWCFVCGICLTSSLITAIKTFPQEEFVSIKGNIEFYINNGDSDTPFGQDHKFGKYGEKWFFPYHFSYYAATVNSTQYPMWYFSLHGAINYFPAIFAYYIGSQPANSLDSIVDELQLYWQPNLSLPEPKYNVIFMLIESLETWPLEIEPYNTSIAPNLCSLSIDKHVIYVPHLFSQVRHGVSADGQMLLNTGLLPIQNGATCMLYPDNKFPNIASLYPYSSTIDGFPEDAWNQTKMTSAYGYKNYIHPQNVGWTDEEVFKQLIQVLDTIHEPFCTQVITTQSHTPFFMGKNYQSNMPDGMPIYMHDYLGCINIIDRYIGWAIDSIKNIVDMDHTVIVITADHSIFKSKLLNSFSTYAEKAALQLPQNRSYCPLFIYAPNVEHQIINGTFYQMDIYPTLLSVLDIGDHPWKGFGINLTDSTSRVERDTVDESYYYQISNRIIINNALASHQK